VLVEYKETSPPLIKHPVKYIVKDHLRESMYEKEKRREVVRDRMVFRAVITLLEFLRVCAEWG